MEKVLWGKWKNDCMIVFLSRKHIVVKHEFVMHFWMKSNNSTDFIQQRKMQENQNPFHDWWKLKNTKHLHIWSQILPPRLHRYSNCQLEIKQFVYEADYTLFFLHFSVLYVVYRNLIKGFFAEIYSISGFFSGFLSYLQIHSFL